MHLESLLLPEGLPVYLDLHWAVTLLILLVRFVDYFISYEISEIECSLKVSSDMLSVLLGAY